MDRKIHSDIERFVLWVISLVFPPKLPRVTQFQDVQETEGCVVPELEGHIISVREKPHRDAIDRHFAEHANV